MRTLASGPYAVDIVAPTKRDAPYTMQWWHGAARTPVIAVSPSATATPALHLVEDTLLYVQRASEAEDFELHRVRYSDFASP